MQPPGERSIGINNWQNHEANPNRYARAGAAALPYTEIQCPHSPSHTRAPVLQLQVNAGAAAEDIEGGAVGDINQAARADLVVPLFRAEAQRLEGLARARELDT